MVGYTCSVCNTNINEHPLSAPQGQDGPVCWVCVAVQCRDIRQEHALPAVTPDPVMRARVVASLAAHEPRARWMRLMRRRRARARPQVRASL